MIAIIVGALSYIFFAWYDYAGLRPKSRLSYRYFVLGALLLAAATIYLLSLSDWAQLFSGRLGLKLLEAGAALLFLFLLLYTLFGALPPQSYISDEPTLLVEHGVYALCRHPGVWWLGLFYLFAWLFSEQELMLRAGIVFTTLDIVYVYWQDRFIFIKTIAGYEQYQKDTPFLLPNKQSIRRCLGFPAGRGGGSG